MESGFLNETSLIQYSPNKVEKITFNNISEIKLVEQGVGIKWFNTYGLDYESEIFQVISESQIDDFLIKLMMDDEHPNKVIQLEDVLFVSARILIHENLSFSSEQMIFIVSSNMLWSIQEKKGDYFDWIRERLENNIGIARKKKADYLLYLILESVLDNYNLVFDKFSKEEEGDLSIFSADASPAFAEKIEMRKHNLFKFKKAASSLRDTISKLEKNQVMGFKGKYFSELKEQNNHLLSDIDFELQEQESMLNLMFSYQGQRLNEVMKTLTIFSVIFIPLTFMAGIYGMNFKYIPELELKNGYFYLWGLMVVVALICIWYFKKKKWF
ncbi:CorA family divalent cation transporter [Membranihabitans marinus]|uniref:CorA family divalent cation transporter n=1 Tax=Membranihabitans marinus TaxID=1227546 RepID=UPI001F1F08D6|nr:CorA family divalent cation transporter [Membranihabitans marinus]